MAGRAVHEVQSSSLKQRVTGPNERRQSNGEISSLEALAEGVSANFMSVPFAHPHHCPEKPAALKGLTSTTVYIWRTMYANICLSEMGDGMGKIERDT